MVPKVRYLGVHDLLAKQKEVRLVGIAYVLLDADALVVLDHSHPHQGHFAIACRPSGS